jgi:Short C-terminal domain
MVKLYLKTQLWVFLCGGLVGPGYLVIYYEIQPPEDRHILAWMFWAGLAITVADVLVALVVTGYRARSAAKSETMELELKRELAGVLAIAQITGMAETTTTINDHPLVTVSMHIAGPGFAFDAEERLIATVTTTGNFNARKLVVLVDPDTQEFEVDWQRSALVNGLAAARFTFSEDNKTYDLTGQAEPLLEIFQLLKDNGISLNGPLDLRSADPALRHAVNDIVRRAAAAQPAPAYAGGPGDVADPPGATPRPSAAQRLQELAGLHANEAITDDEYEAKRRQVISEI